MASASDCQDAALHADSERMRREAFGSDSSFGKHHKTPMMQESFLQLLVLGRGLRGATRKIA